MSFLSSRQKVLSIFKQLHKTRKIVFNEDTHALGVIRGKINEEFRKNKDINDTEKVEELLAIAVDAEGYLKKTVVQAEYNPATNTYKVNITEHTELMDNPMSFDPDAKLPKRTKKTKCDDTVS